MHKFEFGDVMSEKTLIYLVRHGESIGNKNKMFLGHTDLDLSEHGYKQARATAAALSKVKLDKIYSSDLQRAYNTAKAHADLRGMTVHTDHGLRELYVGDWEGKHVDEIIEKYGEKVFKEDWHGGFGTFAFPNGESTMEGSRRFYQTVMKIASENIGKTLLIAAHAAVIRGFWSIICGVAPEDIVEKIPFPSNASYSVVEFDGEKLSPIEYSHDEHLADIGITKVIVG